jgi:hypothetical protein
MVNMNVGRREALKKIGVALAAASASGTLAMAVPVQKAMAVSFKIPVSAKLVEPSRANGQYDVFVAHNGESVSISLVNSNDAASSRALSSAMNGASPAKAIVAGGVIRVGVGSAAARGSVASMGAISFKGAQVSNAVMFAR